MVIGAVILVVALYTWKHDGKSDTSLVSTTTPTNNTEITNDTPDTGHTPEVVRGDTAEIKVGEMKIINGLTVRLISVPNDYRCPVDVQCIEAGAIVAKVTLTDGSNTEAFNMPSDEVPHAFGPYQISIESVSPDAHSQTTIKQGDYKVTFKVVK
jgi:hypothetical protein